MPYVPTPYLGAEGMNVELPDGQVIGIGQLQAGLNIDCDRLSIKKRGGLVSFFSGISGIPMLFQDFVDANNKRWIMVVTTTKVYSFDEVTLTLTDRTPGGYSASLGSPARATTFQFKWFLVNKNIFDYWDGITATMSALPGGSPSTAADVLGFGNHLHIVDSTNAGTEDKFKDQWSDFLNGTIWTTGDALSADLVDGGDAIMGVALYGTNMQLFKTDSMYVVTPIPSPLFYQFDRRITYAGCIATATLQETPIGTIGLWRNDVYVFDTISARPLRGIRGQSLRKDLFATLNTSNVNAAFALKDVINTRYMLFIPTQAWTATVPVYKVYVFNWEYNTWSIYDFSDVPGGVSAGGGSSHIFQVGRTFAQSTYAFSASPYRFNDFSSQAAPTYLLGGVTSGKAYRLPSTPVYTDDGAAYRSYAQTGLTDFGNGWPGRTMVKRAHLQSVVQSAGSLNLSLITSDDGSTQTLVGPLAEAQTSPAPIGAWFEQSHTYTGLQIDDVSGTTAWEAKRCIFETEPGGER